MRLAFSPFFPDAGKIDFPAREFCFYIGETQFPNFPPISPEFPQISQLFLMIPPDSPVSSAVFNTTSQVYFFSENQAYFMHITCIFENEDSTLCETKNYKSMEFWGNSGEFWGNQMKRFSFFFTRFPRFEIHFPIGEI